MALDKLAKYGFNNEEFGLYAAVEFFKRGLQLPVACKTRVLE